MENKRRISEKRALEVYPIESYEMNDDMYRQRGAYVKGYEKGYQESKKHTIDKVCEHLAQVLPYEIGFVDANIILIDLRKAMEE